MNHLAVVTYLRPGEDIPSSILNFLEAVHEHFCVTDFIVFLTEETQEPIIRRIPSNISVHQIVDGGKTKYARLCEVIQKEKYHIILSLDSDITLEMENLSMDISSFFDSEAAVAWGTIGVTNQSFVANTVAIDKFLSHRIIRPFLWSLGAGISIPGQCFILKTWEYKNFGSNIDTFLDDLQFGLITNLEKKKYYFSPKTWATEEAKMSLRQLIHQRHRWSLGYVSVLANSMHISFGAFSLVLLHGVFYHVLFPVCVIGLFILSLYHFFPAILLYGAMILFLSSCRFSWLLEAVGYTLIFPLLHLFWLVSTVKHLLFS